MESLLEAAGKTLGFSKPIQEAAQAVAAGSLAPDRRIGNYELVRLIGSGGMGDVFLASRADDQFERQVAIKLMRAGLEKNPHLLPRFRAERQILANLDHPNIARLLDGSVAPEGCPYLVMEYVDGVALDDYCREHELSERDRLRLFLTVCSAVEYAHQNLVIHRDIKPANILVTKQGVPKLLDFGIAKLLDPFGPDLETTRSTQRLLTPDYASPEQILGKKVTTATDVYGLGALLYELLSGRRPFGGERRSPSQVIRDICEKDPAPSDLSPDLDCIVRKAMNKSPEARYASVAQLASDVEAELEGRPVIARGGDWRYRTVKYVLRHRWSVSLGALAAILLVAFASTMAILMHRAQVERTMAEREAAFLLDLFKGATPDVARGQVVTARNLLDQGAKRVDKELAGQPEVRASLLENMAEAYQALGLFPEAEDLASRAYHLRPTGDSLFLWANLIRLRGEYAKAEPLFRELVQMRKQSAGERDPLYAKSLSALGECLYLENKDAEAEPLLRKSLAIYRQDGPNYGSEARNYLALLVERKGDYAEASELLKEAVAIDGRTDGKDGPNYTISLHNLASDLIDLGDLNGAEEKLRETLAIRRKVLGNNHPMLVYTLNNLGYVLLEKGEWRQAEPFLREALELDRKRLGDKHPQFAGVLNNVARVEQAKGNFNGARDMFNQALEILRQANAFNSWPASQILLNLGMLEFAQGNYGPAEAFSRQVVEMRRKLGGDRTPAFAAATTELAEDLLFEGDPISAEPLLRQALEIRRKKFAAKHPVFISAEVRLGEDLIAEGKAKEAEPLLRDAVSAVKTAPFALPAWQVAEAQSALGACLSALGQKQEAEELIRESGRALESDPRVAFRQQAAERLERIRANALKGPNNRTHG